MKRFWALVALVVATEVHVGMSNKRIRCIIQFVANVTRDWRMVPPAVVVEVMYQFKVLIAIQTCIVTHLIDLEFPDFIFIRGRWSGGISRGNISQLYIIFRIWFTYSVYLQFHCHCSLHYVVVCNS